jgi:hypothetical protein
MRFATYHKPRTMLDSRFEKLETEIVKIKKKLEI